MSDIEKMYDYFDGCNGEIRIIAGRYCRGFHCVISLTERFDNEFFDKFEDFIGGDNDYFDARDYFESTQNQRDDYFGYAWAETAVEALKKAEESAVIVYLKQLEDFNKKYRQNHD